jgi:hypothetical protein
MLMCAGEPGANGPDWHIERDSSFRVAQPSPIAESNNLLLLGSKRAQRRKYLCQHPLVVQPTSGVIPEVPSGARRGQLGEQALTATQRPVGIADGVVRYCEEPGQYAVTVKLNRTSATPCFQEDDTRQLLRTRPRGRTTETVEVDCVRVSFKQLTEGGTVVLGGSPPQLAVGYRLVRAVHGLYMSGTR